MRWSGREAAGCGSTSQLSGCSHCHAMLRQGSLCAGLHHMQPCRNRPQWRGSLLESARRKLRARAFTMEPDRGTARSLCGFCYRAKWQWRINMDAIARAGAMTDCDAFHAHSCKRAQAALTLPLLLPPAGRTATRYSMLTLSPAQAPAPSPIASRHTPKSWMVHGGCRLRHNKACPTPPSRRFRNVSSAAGHQTVSWQRMITRPRFAASAIGYLRSMLGEWRTLSTCERTCWRVDKGSRGCCLSGPYGSQRRFAATLTVYHRSMSDRRQCMAYLEWCDEIDVLVGLGALCAAALCRAVFQCACQGCKRPTHGKRWRLLCGCGTPASYKPKHMYCVSVCSRSDHAPCECVCCCVRSQAATVGFEGRPLEQPWHTCLVSRGCARHGNIRTAAAAAAAAAAARRSAC
jgi:hypothetical protein